MSGIIDVHSHYMPLQVAENTTFFKAHWSDLDRQLNIMDEFGIERSVLLYPTSDAHLHMGGWQPLARIYNQEISAVVKKYPTRFVGAGILPVDQPQHFSEELKRISDLNLKILSLASSYEGKFLDDEIFFPVYEFTQKNNVPIHVHPQIMNPIGEDRVRDPLLTPVLEYVFDVSVCIGKLMMNEVFLKFPDVKFIFAHYGGVLPIVKERFDNTYQMLRKRGFVKDIKKLPGEYFKNLHFDVSGSKSVASLLCCLEMVDVSQILFGSDFPANQNLSASLAAIDQSPLSSVQKEQLLRGNFLNLFPKKVAF